MPTHLTALIILLILGQTFAQDECLPLWPRLQFGSVYSDPTSSEKMIIKFNTRSQCPKSYTVITSSNGTIRKIPCQAITIRCTSHMNHYKTYIQRCSISQINYQQNITYLPYGSNYTSGTAIPFSSDPIPASIIDPNSTSQTKFIILADWSQLHQKIGIYNSVNQTIDKIRGQMGIHGIIVNGDIAYDLDSNNGTNYEQFLNMLSRSARYVPVLMIAGNHQHNSKNDELLFSSTFEQYGADEIFASGLSIGPVYIATFDPYADLYGQIKQQKLRKQVGPAYEGFIEAINNGTKTGKLILPVSHYPLKCSAKAEDCQNDVIKLKQYFDLMFENNIKFYIGAHYHTYERLYPYCKNGTFSLIPPPYDTQNLKDCLVSVIEGIAGNDDKIVQVYNVVKDYTAKLSFNKTGVGLLTVNMTQIRFEHYSSDNILTLEDEFQISYQPQTVDKFVMEQ